MKIRAMALYALMAAVGCGGAQAEVVCVEDGNQAEMNTCAADDFGKADAELNGLWETVIAGAKRLDEGLNDGQPGYEETLRQGQRAWLEYRDRQCDLEGFDVRGGSMEPMVRLTCLAIMTRERIKELQETNGTTGEPRW